MGLLLAAAVSTWHTTARAADEPVDVPITRGKVDLSGIKPTLAMPAPPAAPTVPTGPAGGTAPPTAAPSTPARPKPRTVAEYAAEAKAKAAAEAAANAAAKGSAPPAAAAVAVPITAPAKPAAPATAAATPPQPAEQVIASPAARPAVPDKAPDKATPKPAAKTTAAAPAAAPAARKAPDEGLDKVAVRLVEAMARASAKQDKRETVRSPPKKAADTSTRAAAAHGSTAAHADAHWSYEGDTGPANWAKLKPEFNVCAIGQRQSPIPIDDSATLQGPAEPIGFNYRPSEGSVVNNGHTIQVDVAPGNSIAVRSGNFDLLQFHFHHPSEEQVNGQRFPMVAHLVHKSAEGQLAVVAVLLTTGEANPAIDTVWKYLPVDTGDRVKLPPGVLNLPDLLPKDQRYYQFMGSLTTPPCTEGVLWMVLKTPVTLSPAQIRLFGQLFPNNARPVQELNERPVREGL